MKTAVSLSLLLVVCTWALAAPAAPLAPSAEPSPTGEPSTAGSSSPSLALGTLPSDDYGTSAPSADNDPDSPAPASVRDKKAVPATCITFMEPLTNALTTRCGDIVSGAPLDARTFHHSGDDHHHSGGVKLVPVKIKKTKFIKVPVIAHGYDSHSHYPHSYGGHRAAWAQQQRFTDIDPLQFPTSSFGEVRGLDGAQVEQMRQMEAQALEQAHEAQGVESPARSGLSGPSYAPLPVINNFLPSIPVPAAAYPHGAPGGVGQYPYASGGGGVYSHVSGGGGVFPQAPGVGVFPRVPDGGGCGAIPLLLSCSPSLVRGDLVQTAHGHGYGGGYHSAGGLGGGAGVVYGGGGGYQLSPWVGGGAYRENEEAAAASSLNTDTSGSTSADKN